ncbi:hypothetical protein BGW38_009728 [Lunasporangiospora selenospora]|uniref:Acyl-CoA synthetase (AMP-forming)/AMP-acid ligase II n=1 Tax=Lunasporangiospora selenospora TaxID=979761 RepID=A0A9P6FXL3_9FUNG|nr:hypothetical protein BGW38_009728 [Lunasporangiospora selenospora]
MHIYKSKFQDLVLPKTNLFSFITSNPKGTPESFHSITDAVTKQVITLQEWKRDTLRWATGLQSIGFKRGDTLAIFSFNQIDYSLVMFGPLVLGAVTTTASSAYNAEELALQLSDSRASVMVTHPESLATARAAAKKVGLPEEKIFLFGDRTIDGFRPYSSLMPPVGTPRDKLANVVNLDGEAAVKTTALICYSSGTTGRSKGVELTHYGLSSNLLQISMVDPEFPPAENASLSVLPMYHMYSIAINLMYGLYSGMPNIVLQKFVFEDFLEAIQRHKIVTLNLVPPQVLLLAKSPLVDKYDLSSVRFLTAAAAPCSRELVEALTARFPKIGFRQAYGMTELSPASHFGQYENQVHGSVGIMLPNQEIRLVDPETGTDVPKGEAGEVWIRGPNVMKGYLNNPAATKDTIDPEGWLHTGDIGLEDNEGNFFIVDRLKELIKYKGFQVPLAELEAVLVGHPHISDAAVIGVEDPSRATEVPLAFVVRNESTAEGKVLTDKDVTTYVASHVAQHKQLRGGVRFIDAIPKSPSGKILRRLLRDHLKEEPQSPPKARL